MSPIVKLIWEGNLPKIAMGWQEVETVPTSSPLASGVRDTPSNSVQETSDDLLENFLDSVVETSFKVVVDWTVNVCSGQGVELMLTDTIFPLPVPDFALGEMFSGQPASQPAKPKLFRCPMPECMVRGAGRVAYLCNLTKHFNKYHLNITKDDQTGFWPCKANEWRFRIGDEDEEDFSTFQSVEITPLAKDLLEVNEEVDLSAEKEELMFSMELDENQEEEAMSSSLQCKLESCIENLDEGPVLYSPIELNPTPFFPPTSSASSSPARSPPATTPPASSTPMVSRSPSPSPSSGTEVEDRVETMPWEPRVFPLSEEEAREIEVVFT